MTLSASVEDFRVALRQPVVTARGRITERAGQILELRDEAGRCGTGELAPLPGWSSVDPAEARRQLVAGADALESEADWLAAVTAPEARAALDAALRGLDAARAGRPLWEELGGRDGAVEVNALVVGDTPDALGLAAERALGEGYRTVKVKAGLGDDPARMTALARVLGAAGVRVRVDANSAWTVSEAAAALVRLDHQLGDRIEYVEDPVESLRDLAELRPRSPVAVAADELSRSAGALDRIIDGGLADVVVLKPPLLGGITPTLEQARRARAHGVDVVVSSLYDGPVGLEAWCHVAAAVGGDRAHGLGTAALLDDRRAERLVPRRGLIRL